MLYGTVDGVVNASGRFHHGRLCTGASDAASMLSPAAGSKGSIQGEGKAVTDTADVVADAALAIGHCQVQPGSDEDTRVTRQRDAISGHA